MKIPLLGKFAAKAYLIAVKGLLKISSGFFSKVNKKIDKAVNERLNKAKGAVDVPLNFAESTVKETWMPRITENADKFMDKARTYIRRVYFGMSLPILLIAVSLILVSMAIVV